MAQLRRVSVVAVILWGTMATLRAPHRGAEAAAIGSIRAVLSAERTFADISGGHFGVALPSWPSPSAYPRLPSFCGDDTGQLFVNQSPRPAVVDGRCADRSTPLE